MHKSNNPNKSKVNVIISGNGNRTEMHRISKMLSTGIIRREQQQKGHNPHTITDISGPDYISVFA